MIAPPHTVSMKAVFPNDCGMLYPGSRFRENVEFVFSNYNMSSRKGWVQIPKHYLALILANVGKE